MNIHIQVFRWTYVFIFLDICLEFLSHMITVVTEDLLVTDLLSKWLHYFTILTMYKVPISLHPRHHLLLSFFLIIGILVRCEVRHIILFLICIFIISNDFEHIFLFTGHLNIFFGVMFI